MYGNTSRFVVLPFTHAASCSPDYRAELLRSLEAERIPNGLAFVTNTAAAAEPDDPLSAVAARRQAFDDSPAAVVARRRELLAAVDDSQAAIALRRRDLLADLHEPSLARPGRLTTREQGVA